MGHCGQRLSPTMAPLLQCNKLCVTMHTSGLKNPNICLLHPLKRWIQPRVATPGVFFWVVSRRLCSMPTFISPLRVEA